MSVQAGGEEENGTTSTDKLTLPVPHDPHAWKDGLRRLLRIFQAGDSSKKRIKRRRTLAIPRRIILNELAPALLALCPRRRISTPNRTSAASPAKCKRQRIPTVGDGALRPYPLGGLAPVVRLVEPAHARRQRDGPVRLQRHVDLLAEGDPVGGLAEAPRDRRHWRLVGGELLLGGANQGRRARQMAVRVGADNVD